MARGGVSFELERFGWVEGVPVLEVAGRWRSPRRRRLGAASLVVSAEGGRRLTPSASTGEARSAPEPELWRAEFYWPGSPAAVRGAELEVGPSLVIELPAPDGPLPPAAAPRTSAPSAVELARLELAAARRQAEADRAEAARLRESLEALRREAAAHEGTRAQLADTRARLEDERAALRQAREQAEAARKEVEATRKEADARDKRATRELAAARKDADDREKRARERHAVGSREAAEPEQRLVDRAAAVGGQAEMGAGEEAEAQLDADVHRLGPEPRALQRSVSETADTLQPPPPDGLASGDRERTVEWRPEDLEDDPEPGPRTSPSAAPPPPLPPVYDPYDDFEDTADTDTLLLGPPPSRGPRGSIGASGRRRATDAPRRLAERPPNGSPALRAIAGVLLLLLSLVLIVALLLLA